MKDVEIRLDYETRTGDIKNIDIIKTNETGKYLFSSLIPGLYIINAVKSLDYSAEKLITINENETLTQNISLDYTSISLNGFTKDNDTSDILSNITINFNPDLNVENNTAQLRQIKSDDKGFYSVEIKPGIYDIIVNQTIEENNITYRLIHQGKIEIEVGEGSKTLDIMITKFEEA
jgi:hypothetical protein